ncbi:MAG: TVP38/TMEM64 family protein [Syntrophaceae bacterium]|nr:TVP38/TMEM64 family protein [Syntrophaceae bacterium]
MNAIATRKANKNAEKKSGRDLWKPLFLLTIVIAVAITARVFGWDEQFLKLKAWILSLGPWAPLVFVLLYVLMTILAVPGTVMSFIAGGIFGALNGIILVSIASTVGACLAFLIGRYFAREAIFRRLSDNDKYRRLDDLTARHGAIIVAIVRLIPLFPFNVVNYGFGLTGVPFRTYAFWSWLCMLPGTILYVVGADTFTTAVTMGNIPWNLVFVFAVAAIILIGLVHFAYRLLHKKESSRES